MSSKYRYATVNSDRTTWFNYFKDKNDAIIHAVNDNTGLVQHVELRRFTTNPDGTNCFADAKLVWSKTQKDKQL